MKFVLLSDMHLLWQNPVARMDNLVEEQFKKLEFVLQLANDENAVILQAGDFFDKPRSWGLLPMVIDLIRRYDSEIFCVYGQHDTYLYSEETRDRTNLGILAKAGLVNVAGFVSKWADPYLYGASYGEDLPEPTTEGFNIGIIHASICAGAVYPGHSYTEPEKFLKGHPRYDLILCGDIHQSFIAKDHGRTIVNTGPMLRKEATEYNFGHKPHVVLYNTNRTMEEIEIPHSKANKVLSRDHIERADETETMLDSFIDAIGGGAEIDGVSFDDNLVAFIKANKIGKDVVAVLSNTMEDK